MCRLQFLCRVGWFYHCSFDKAPKISLELHAARDSTTSFGCFVGLWLFPYFHAPFCFGPVHNESQLPAASAKEVEVAVTSRLTSYASFRPLYSRSDMPTVVGPKTDQQKRTFPFKTYLFKSLLCQLSRPLKPQTWVIPTFTPSTPREMKKTQNL